MLELDVLEQRPLNSLESSISRTVAHRWPLLHVPFIHELTIGSDSISDPGNLDHQVAVQVNVQEPHYLLRGISEDHKIPPELVTCARKKDTGELFIVNSAVMLDTVEKVSPMEISESAQNMILQESDESSALQIREDFLEITIARDLTKPLHMKDDHTLNDPVSKMNDDAAGMEVMGTGAVLQSEQNERVGSLPNDPLTDECSGLGISDSARVLTESGNLVATKSHTSIAESPKGFLCDECHQCTAPNTSDGDSVKCLEVEYLPCLQNPSTLRTIDAVDSSDISPRFHGNSICDETQEVCLATCLLERLEPNTADDIDAPIENMPRDEDSDIIIESVQQEIEIVSSDKKQNDIIIAYHSDTSSADVASTRLQHVPSEALEVENDTSSGNLEDDLPTIPNLPFCFENLTSAKAWDTECSLSSSVSDCNSVPDCHNQHARANNSQTDHSYANLPNVLCSDSPTNMHEEPSYTKFTSTSSVDGCETCSVEVNSFSRDCKLDGEDKEQLLTSISPSTSLDNHIIITGPNVNSHCPSTEAEEDSEELTFAQSKGLCDTVPALLSNASTSYKTEDDHCLVVTEESCLTSFMITCGEAITSSQMQSDLLEAMKETDDLKVPCQTVSYGTDETPSDALVPYIDIWGCLLKHDVESLSLINPDNVTSKKAESQEQKDKEELKCNVNEGEPLEEHDVSMEECMLKAFENPKEVDSRNYDENKEEPILDSISKIDTLLVQEVNVSIDSFPCRAECHNISSMPSTINQSDVTCCFNSDALCDSSVPVDVHHMSILDKKTEVRGTGDSLQSVRFLKEIHTPHLRHLGDPSASLPTSLPESSAALTKIKRLKSHREVLLGKVQLHVTNHAESSAQIQDDLSKSLSLKQGTELGPRCRSTHEEPFTAPVQFTQISAADPKLHMKPVVNKKKSPFMFPMTHELKPALRKAEVSITTEATQVKSQRNLLDADIKTHKKLQNDCRLLSERRRQSASCHVEMLSGTTENRKKYNLRPAPQSLNSTSQEAKRPKISNVKDVCSASSDLSDCAGKFLESHHLSQPRQACKRKEPSSAIRNGPCLSTNPSVKRQPSRKCKSISAPESLPVNRNTRTCESPPVLKIHNSLDINVEYKSLPSKQVDANLISKPHYPKMSRRGAVSQRSLSLLKCNPDQMLLNKLSRIANRLTAPSKASCTVKTSSSNMRVVPFRGVKIQARKLLNVFSCVSMRMNSQPGQLWQENVCLTSSRDRLVSQSMNLCHTSYFKSLDNAFPLNTCSNLSFPVSFHVNIDPSCFSEFLKLNPPDFILRCPQPAARSPSELSEWTLSLFLSSHVPTDTETVHLLTQWNPQFRSLESRSESRHKRKSVMKSGCSMLGLHTVLALSSPGCYRLWTRRRNLGSRIPTVQKLSVTQFAHGLKGLSPPFSRKNQFSSLAFSLGRVLSTWSQHGFSAFSSDCANTHPNCSVWLPSQSSNIISVCDSPNPLACFPQLPLNPIPQLNTYSLPVQNINLALKPRICHLEDLSPPFSLSVKKHDPPPLCWSSSQPRNDVQLPSCSLKQEIVPKHSFAFTTVKVDGLNLPSKLQKNNIERPFGLPSLEQKLKPVVNITLQKDQNLTVCSYSQCELSIQEDAAAHISCPELPTKGLACPFEQKEDIIIPCTHSPNKGQGGEKGSFERKPQRVSQIRIRKTIPKPDPNLTPMGLPKPKRVNKKEFSLEDIYTNKNYKSPPPARSLETIFEEPKEKNGILISVSQQKRKRILEFRDCTVPRLKRPKGKMKVMSSCKRGRKAAMEGVQLDALLIQKLMDLENCLLEEEAMERGSAASAMPS
ncbi:protein PRR14L isoform X2 [Dendropsophus ebraccatus]